MSQTELTLDLPDPTATDQFGIRLGRLLRTGDVVALEGTLGAGEGEHARGWINGDQGDVHAVRGPSGGFLFERFADAQVELVKNGRGIVEAVFANDLIQ